MVKESCSDLEIVNMLETCADYAKKDVALGHVKRLGLLATLGTHQTKVYHNYFKTEDGLLLIELDSAGQERVHEAIYNKAYGIKSHSQPVTAKAKEVIKEEILKLIEQGVETIILGCSELPLAVDPQEFRVNFLDPAQICARRLIELISPEKLNQL
jgi:aspartate racemase